MASSSGSNTIEAKKAWKACETLLGRAREKLMGWIDAALPQDRRTARDLGRFAPSGRASLLYLRRDRDGL